MRVEKRYFTFMNQQVNDEEEAEIAERQEYEDVALAVKRLVKILTAKCAHLMTAVVVSSNALPMRGN